MTGSAGWKAKTIEFWFKGSCLHGSAIEVERLNLSRSMAVCKPGGPDREMGA